MRFSDVLASEWRPALGCTEPASIAYAASTAAALASGPIRSVRLACDPRIYKNCYAVGIPHSGRRSGLRQALAIGALLPDPSLRLECFRAISPAILEAAEQLVAAGALHVEVDTAQDALFVDCTVERAGGTGRAVIAGDHTGLVALEKDGVPVPLAPAADGAAAAGGPGLRARLAGLSFHELIELGRGLTPADRAALRRGLEMNMTIARHGLSLFPQRFARHEHDADAAARAGRLVCGGVYARMSGEDFSVMSLAGSGNKGITCAVPLVVFGEQRCVSAERLDEALALALLVTVVTTHHLGTLSAVCGCSNAAGIGLAAGLVLLDGGGPTEVSLALNNMVGNVTGMVCDGAKIGCALKTMTAVDAAARAATLAMAGMGIPETDGIVGGDGMASLANLGRIATRGMTSVDAEILAIMREKM